MPDTIFQEPDLTLLLGPDDTAIRVGVCPPDRVGRRFVGGTVHVAVHRRHGPWTHVYRVLQEERPDRLQVHLHKIFEGERVSEAQDWALANLLQDGGAP